MGKKKIVFLTGTRADFGKLKSLMKITQNCDNFDVHIFATGMHMNSKYGRTVDEVIKCGFQNIYQFINHDTVEHMDRTLAKTIDGFSHYIAEINPDLIVVHGDRVEALAGAIVGSLNNILVAHVEGGEVSGTIDELIRHAVSKMSHIHLVSNKKAKKRLIQLGEKDNSIFVIGSPDLDLMNPEHLPSLETVKQYYEIEFKKYAILMFHPITTEYDQIKYHIKSVIDAVLSTDLNYIVIYPNNDLGSIEILNEYERLTSKKFKIFPSLRFEYFLRLLENADFIIGNSSAGIKEAPYYKTPAIDIGTRQNNRLKLSSIYHASYNKSDIINNIKLAMQMQENYTTFDTKEYDFGKGNSDLMFFDLLKSPEIWNIDHQKQFQDMDKE